MKKSNMGGKKDSGLPEECAPATRAAQALGRIDETTRAIVPPVHVASTYQRDPDNADALNHLGVLAAQGGHPRDAKDLLAKAIAIDGMNPVFHYNLGLVYQGLGERDGAIASYERGALLKRHCEAKLKDAQQKVDKIVAAGGEVLGAEPADDD